MARPFKGTMGIAYPIDGISRKLALRSEIAGNKSFEASTHDVEMPNVQYMGGMQRGYNVVTGSGKSQDIKVQYLFIKKHKAALNDNQRATINLFSAIARAVKAIKRDLTQLTRIQQQYIQARADVTKTINGISVKGYSDIWRWVFAVQFAGLKADEDYPVNTFPNAFDA